MTCRPRLLLISVVREGCVALRYSVHFFTIFLFHATIIIEGEGIGARSVRFPHRFCVCPTRSRKWGIRSQGHMYVWSSLFQSGRSSVVLRTLPVLHWSGGDVVYMSLAMSYRRWISSISLCFTGVSVWKSSFRKRCSWRSDILATDMIVLCLSPVALVNLLLAFLSTAATSIVTISAWCYLS